MDNAVLSATFRTDDIIASSTVGWIFHNTTRCLSETMMTDAEAPMHATIVEIKIMASHGPCRRLGRQAWAFGRGRTPASEGCVASVSAIQAIRSLPSSGP